MFFSPPQIICPQLTHLSAKYVNSVQLPVTMTVDDGIPIRGEIQFSAGDETIESLLYNDFFTDAKGIIYEIAALSQHISHMLECSLKKR